MNWQKTRAIVLTRDNRCCVSCGVVCQNSEAHVHHLIPRSYGGSDEPSNLVTLCSGCHGAHHPNLHASLSKRAIERWALKLAKWLDFERELPDGTLNLGGALRLFGLNRFRENQLEVILTALKGESVMLVSPTGSGKTLCFQLPTLMHVGTAFVISPLKALMSEQVSDLQRKKIPSSFINGDLSPEEKKIRYELLENHALKFLYCTPERFDSNMVRPEEVKRISCAKPSYLVVDEAHCIDKWGGDFRQNYSRLGKTRELLGNPPVLAFTATAGIDSQKRILKSLGIPDAKIIVSGVDRPNIALIRLKIETENQKALAIKSIVEVITSGRAMIFVPTIKIGNELQESLASLGLDIPFYHSKCGTANERDMLIGRFTGRIKPEVKRIICTNAFGMGLDIPDVRLVVHWQHPASVEDYLQEFGRAGRDGKQALAVLLTSQNDTGLLTFMAEKTIENTDLDKETKNSAIKNKVSQIQAINSLATNQNMCFRKGIIDYFIEKKPIRSKSLALRIVEWLFSTKKKKNTSKWCCDRCNHVTIYNYLHSVQSLLKHNE